MANGHSAPNGRAIEFLFRLIAYVLVVATSLVLINTTAAGRDTNLWLNEWVANVCAALLRATGLDATASGTFLYTANYSVRIADECNGLLSTVLVAGAVLTMPLTAARRALGVLGSVPLVGVCNQLRLACVMYVGTYRPDYVDQFEATYVRAGHWAIIVGAALYWFSRPPVQKAIHA